MNCKVCGAQAAPGQKICFSCGAPIEDAGSQAAPQQVTQPVQQPVAQPIQQPVAPPVQQPISQPVQQPVQQPVADDDDGRTRPIPILTSRPTNTYQQPNNQYGGQPQGYQPPNNQYGGQPQGQQLPNNQYGGQPQGYQPPNNQYGGQPQGQQLQNNQYGGQPQGQQMPNNQYNRQPQGYQPPNNQYGGQQRPPYGNQYGYANTQVKNFNLISAYVEFFKNYANFSGRSRRSEYWFVYLANLIINTVLQIFMSIVGGASMATMINGGEAAAASAGAAMSVGAIIVMIISSVYALGTLVPGLALCVRRLHDTGRSWVSILLGLIPCVGGIILIVFMATDSQPGPNQYGPNPKGVQAYR